MLSLFQWLFQQSCYIIHTIIHTCLPIAVINENIYWHTYIINFSLAPTHSDCSLWTLTTGLFVRAPFSGVVDLQLHRFWFSPQFHPSSPLLSVSVLLLVPCIATWWRKQSNDCACVVRETLCNWCTCVVSVVIVCFFNQSPHGELSVRHGVPVPAPG